MRPARLRCSTDVCGRNDENHSTTQRVWSHCAQHTVEFVGGGADSMCTNTIFLWPQMGGWRGVAGHTGEEIRGWQCRAVSTICDALVNSSSVVRDYNPALGQQVCALLTRPCRQLQLVAEHGRSQSRVHVHTKTLDARIRSIRKG